MNCPICNRRLPARDQDRRLSYSGILVCGDAECEQRADELARCSGPDCLRPAIAHGLCAAHYRQQLRGRELAPLRRRPEVPREVVALRVSPRCRAAVLEDGAGAREALEVWAGARR